MRRILNCGLVGLCGTLVFACWSPSGWRKDAPPKAAQPTVAATPTKAQPTEMAPSKVEPAPGATVAKAPAPVAAKNAADQAEPYQSREPGMAPQGEPPAGQQPAQAPTETEQAAPEPVAVAKVENIKGKEIGTVKFEQEGEWVVMTANFTNLPPGKHGIQLRENGDCGGKNASRSGGHFNPSKTKHGPPEAAERHVGDFGNITVAKDGTAQFEMKTDAMSVRDGEASVVGRSLIITKKADDGKTQPSGNAGPAIACGVVRAEKPAAEDS